MIETAGYIALISLTDMIHLLAETESPPKAHLAAFQPMCFHGVSQLSYPPISSSGEIQNLLQLIRTTLNMLQ